MSSDHLPSPRPVNDPCLTPSAASAKRPETLPDWLILRREDLAAVVANYRREHRHPRQWIGVVTAIGGLFGAAVLTWIAERQGWPEVIGPLSFVGGWTIVLTSLLVVRIRERQLRARHQLHCPACGVPLLDRSLDRGGVSRADLAIATGNCPVCAATILAP